MLSGLLVHFNCSHCSKRNHYNVIRLGIQSLRNRRLLHFFHYFFFSYLKLKSLKDETSMTLTKEKQAKSVPEGDSARLFSSRTRAAHACDHAALSARLPRPRGPPSALGHIVARRLSLWWLFPSLALLWRPCVSGWPCRLGRPRLAFAHGRRELSLGEPGWGFVWVFHGMNVE